MSRDDIEGQLHVAIEAARAAGSLISQARNQTLTVEHKDARELVTEWDKRAEVQIVERLRDAYPTHTIRGEEGGEQQRGDDDTPCWYIDPIDGTNNFIHGLPWYAVSIGQAIAGVPRIGVIYAPACDWMFSAAPGHGARLNDQPISVSSRHPLSASLIATGFPYDRTTFDNVANLKAMLGRARGIRRVGVASLDCAFVAAGWIEGYFEYKIRPWDICAGVALVREAGGNVTNSRGRGLDLDGAEIVASNALIHHEMVATLGGVRGARGIA